MKANRKRREERNDRAEVGIGTMIVFIAAVIVAAIAAAVLVNTAGNLQRTAQETGDQTEQEVSANLFVRDIIINDTDTDDNVDDVYWYLSLAPGADAVDLNETVLRYQAGENNTEVLTTTLDQTNCDSPTYQNLGNGSCVRNLEQPSGDNNRYLLSPGDLVRYEIHLSPGSGEISPRTDVQALFMPETGSPTEASFTVPNTMKGDQFRSVK